MAGKNRGYPLKLTVIELDSCSSTNDQLKKQLRESPDRLPLLVTAREQLRGRGRNQRLWHSPAGLGLYSSFGFRLPGSTNIILLPLIAAISVAYSLKEVCNLDFTVKWPNDVLYENKKLAGILIENSIHREEVMSIIGIGINLNHLQVDFPPDLQANSTSLRIICQKIHTPAEINTILSGYLIQWLERMLSGEKDYIIATVNKMALSLRGRKITFHKNNKEKISGIFLGIDGDGALLLRDSLGNTTRYYSGEIIY